MRKVGLESYGSGISGAVTDMHRPDNIPSHATTREVRGRRLAVVGRLAWGG